MTPYKALVAALFHSQRRDPAGFFFSFAFAPVLVLILGATFGNDPVPEFGGRGYLDSTLPGFASLVLTMSGVLQLPVTLVTLRDTGALRRLSLTPLRRKTFLAATLTVHFLVGIAGMLAALAVGILIFGVSLPANAFVIVSLCGFGLLVFLSLGYALAGGYPSIGATMGIGNVLMIVLMISSGAFMPIERLSSGVQRVFNFSPVRWFVELVQHAWDGGALFDTMTPFLLLTGLFVVCSLTGHALFRWNVAR